MAHHNLQVNVTLFPLDDTAISRSFVLDPDHASILVGRASKTANKGLKPDPTNTWFDSPIMSREHASFVMDSCAKILSLRDHGSTHGTWISDIQLQKDQVSPLNPGVFVTFGSKVMSGPITYQPQMFRVTFEWSNWSRPVPYILAPPSTPHHKSITYSVPDESEYESGSDGSGTSVTFVKRQSRVFLVPSSDEESDDNDSVEEVCLTSSKDPKQDEKEARKDGDRDDPVSSPPSMPEPSSPISKSPVRLDSQSDSQSDSSSVVSDVEERSSEIYDSSSSEGSEDEGPEVLPFEDDKGMIKKETSKVTEAAGSLFLENTDSEDDVQPPVVSSTELNQSEYSPPLKTPPWQVLAEARKALYIPKIVSDTVFRNETSTDKVCESGSGGRESFPWTIDPKEPARHSGKQATRVDTVKADLWAQSNAAVGAEEKTQKVEKASNLVYQSHPCPVVQSGDEPSDTHQDQSASKPRSPSPSDAALAKNASKLDARLQHESWHNHLNGWWPGAHNSRNRDVTLAYESFVPTAHYDDWESNRSYCSPVGDIYYGEDPFVYPAYDRCTRDSTNAGEPSSYMDVPFVASNHTTQNDKLAEPVRHEIRFSSTPRAPASTTHTPDGSHPSDHSIQAMPTGTEKLNENAGKSSQASKLDISNLLYEPLPVSPSRSLKRKAEAITCDEPQEKAVQAILQNAITTEKSEESDIPQMPKLVAPDAKCPNLADINTALRTAAPNNDSTNVDVLKRPSKKTKTAAARATGLAKFALGVGVGALGVVGAFVASIPASVRDEAWHEFQNSQR